MRSQKQARNQPTSELHKALSHVEWPKRMLTIFEAETFCEKMYATSQVQRPSVICVQQAMLQCGKARVNCSFHDKPNLKSNPLNSDFPALGRFWVKRWRPGAARSYLCCVSEKCVPASGLKSENICTQCMITIGYNCLCIQVVSFYESFHESKCVFEIYSMTSLKNGVSRVYRMYVLPINRPDLLNTQLVI